MMNNNVIQLDDHRLLKFEAAREGLSYSDYRKKLDLHDIPLEVAIENVKKGVSITEYLQQGYKIRTRFKSAIGSMIAASIIGCFGALMIDKPSRYEKALSNYQRAQEISTTDGGSNELERALKNLETEELYTFGFSRT